MPDITGTVLDARNIPLPGVTIILAVPGAASVVQLTDGNGTFNYPAMAAGTYKLTAVHGSFGYAEDKRIAHTNAADSVVKFAITAPAATPPPDNRYLFLKYFQYILLGSIGAFFFVTLIWQGVWGVGLGNLREIESARGAITYLVAVTTMSMAALLLLAAIMTGGKDLDKRFALGKEILTLLIGILGTIIGFYYGSSVERGGDGQNGADTVRVSSVTLDPVSPKVNAPFTLNAQLGGGTAPYTYSVTFVPPITADTITNKQSREGKIEGKFTVSNLVQPNTTVRMIISGRDSKNVPFTTPDDKQYQFVTSQ